MFILSNVFKDCLKTLQSYEAKLGFELSFATLSGALLKKHGFESLQYREIFPLLFLDKIQVVCYKSCSLLLS